VIDFKVGDVVQLKGDGPNMTIVGRGKYGWGDEEVLLCKWFKNHGELVEETFPLDAVVLVETDK